MESVDSVLSGRDNPKTSQRILYVGFVFFFLLLDFQTWDIFINTPFIALCGMEPGAQRMSNVEGVARLARWGAKESVQLVRSL